MARTASTSDLGPLIDVLGPHVVRTSQSWNVDFDAFAVMPHPDEAVRTGERSGLDAEKVARSIAAGQAKRREQIRSVDGRLEFVASVCAHEDLEPWRNRYRQRVATRHPCTTVRDLIDLRLPRVGSEQAAREPTAR